MTPEFSRPVRAAPPEGGLSCQVEASAAECAALAARMALPGIDALACAWQLSPLPGEAAGRLLGRGRLRARLRLVCVVTLEEFPVALEEEFTVYFVPAGSEAAEDDPEAPDEIPYAGAVIDLGEAAAEQLALAIDPYPRKPGAALPAPEAPRPNPFAVLQGRRRPA